MQKACVVSCVVCLVLVTLTFAADCNVQVGDIAAVKYKNGEKIEIGYKKVLRIEDGKFVYSRVNSLEEEPLRYKCDLSFGTIGGDLMSGDQFLKALVESEVDFVDPVGWIKRGSEIYKEINQKFFTPK